MFGSPRFATRLRSSRNLRVVLPVVRTQKRAWFCRKCVQFQRRSARNWLKINHSIKNGPLAVVFMRGSSDVPRKGKPRHGASMSPSSSTATLSPNLPVSVSFLRRLRSAVLPSPASPALIATMLVTDDHFPGLFNPFIHTITFRAE